MPQLLFADCSAPGLLRMRQGDQFVYRARNGRMLKNPAILRRIERLAIPPAWEDVWICPDPRGHIQAVGRDGRGRRQYRYHPDFRAEAEARKFSAMPRLASRLAMLRQKVDAHMGLPGLCRERVLATLVHLLDATLIRVGNESYARQNESFGLSTLRNEHVALRGAEIRIRFKGKSGKEWDLTYRNGRIARLLRECQHLPGQTLFQYRDDAGRLATITSQDVNAYLRQLAGRRITAKDFRTWWGCVLFVEALHAVEPASSARGRRLQLGVAIREVAGRLGNTPAVCRKSYIDPALIEAWLSGTWPVLRPGKTPDAEMARWFSPAERVTLRMLRACARQMQRPSSEPAAHISGTSPLPAAARAPQRGRRTQRAEVSEAVIPPSMRGPGDPAFRMHRRDKGNKSRENLSVHPATAAVPMTSAAKSTNTRTFGASMRRDG